MKIIHNNKGIKIVPNFPLQEDKPAKSAPLRFSSTTTTTTPAPPVKSVVSEDYYYYDDPGSAPNSSASQRLGSKLNKFTSKRL